MGPEVHKYVCKDRGLFLSVFSGREFVRNVVAGIPLFDSEATVAQECLATDEYPVGRFRHVSRFPLMMMNAGAAAAANAQRVRQMQCEEEQMTPYEPRDLAEDWEFKILRSATGGFRKPERLARILDEEARAGWMLVEKFDNQRVRLKRRAEARKNDRQLDFDPYRSHVGTSEGQVVAVAIAIAFALVFTFVLLANLLK